MQDQTRLYSYLLMMRDAAALHMRQTVISLNVRFSAEYRRVMPEHYERDSLTDLYVRARNKLINSISDWIAPTIDEKAEELAAAYCIIDRIPKPEHY